MQATQRIQGYDSIEQIARGGMATVYKARKISLDMPVAIKVMYPHLAEDVDFIERFKHEAQAAAKTKHPNIVSVLDYGRSEDGSYFIVMEYYDGLTIEELNERHAPIPVDVWLNVVHEVSRGLEAAHNKHLVHRDIKPGNIICGRDGEIKIADFGLVKDIGDVNLVTQAGKVIGTPAYMSPEQTRGEQVGVESDIFSLGVVGYEMLAGRRPFDGSSYSEVVDRIRNETPADIGTMNPRVDEPVRKIIRRMLEKDVQERYRSAADVAGDIERAAAEAGIPLQRELRKAYASDPGGYESAHRTDDIEALRSRAKMYKASPRYSTDAMVSLYKKILSMDPSDAEAKRELEKLGIGTRGTREGKRWVYEDGRMHDRSQRAGASGAPDLTYKVILDVIDPEQETPASFALKVSMRLRIPLPRVKSWARTMPCVVNGRMQEAHARKLVRILGEAGGVARVAVESRKSGPAKSEPKRADGASAVSARPASTDVAPSRPAPERAGPTETVSVIPEPEKADTDRSRVETDARVTREPDAVSDKNDAVDRLPPPDPDTESVVCPTCGWEQGPDFKFCSVCRTSFNEKDGILPGGTRTVVLPSNAGFENPLAEDQPPRNTGSYFRDLLTGKPYLFVGLGLAVVIVAVLILR